MTRRDPRFQDKLSVFLSLATAIAILVASAGGMSVWSSVLGLAEGMMVERDIDLPQWRQSQGNVFSSLFRIESCRP